MEARTRALLVREQLQIEPRDDQLSGVSELSIATSKGGEGVRRQE
jgi:hypothetical protein